MHIARTCDERTNDMRKQHAAAARGHGKSGGRKRDTEGEAGGASGVVYRRHQQT
jgi:hypothetical protein